MRFELKVNGKIKFLDRYTGKEYVKDEIIELDDEKRVREIIRLGVADLVKINAPKEIKKSGNEIVVYQSLLFRIGGIEEADYNLAKQFRDRNITFIFGTADSEQMLRIGKYCNCKIDDNKEIKCDVLILASYDSKNYIEGRVEARKIYQQCHADWVGLKSMGIWRNYEWEIYDKVDKVLAVSTTTRDSLLHAFKKPIESEIVPNILAEPDENDFRVFLSLSRFTSEKGGDLIVKMAEQFNNAGKNYLWFVCGTPDYKLLDELKKNKNIIFLEAGVDKQALIKKADYLVQLSKNESYCYSVHRALEQGVPVIATEIPEMEKIIKNGENGYLVDFNLSNLDIEKIFNCVPKFEGKSEKVEPIWNKVLRGEL